MGMQVNAAKVNYLDNASEEARIPFHILKKHFRENMQR